MSLNPRDYDLGELRRPDGDGLDAAEEPAEPSPADETLRAGHYRELLLLQNEAGNLDLRKPYLASLPDTIAGERTAFEWLDFLVEKGGFKRTYDVLRYYRSVGWIAGPVEDGLRDYLSGIPEADPAETRPFDQSDHLLSLIYIGRLAAE